MSLDMTLDPSRYSKSSSTSLFSTKSIQITHQSRPIEAPSSSLSTAENIIIDLFPFFVVNMQMISIHICSSAYTGKPLPQSYSPSAQPEELQDNWRNET